MTVQLLLMLCSLHAWGSIPVRAGLQIPNGIVWHQGHLYVMEVLKLTRWDGIDLAALNDCDVRLHARLSHKKNSEKIN